MQIKIVSLLCLICIKQDALLGEHYAKDGF